MNEKEEVTTDRPLDMDVYMQKVREILERGKAHVLVGCVVEDDGLRVLSLSHGFDDEVSARLMDKSQEVFPILLGEVERGIKCGKHGKETVHSRCCSHNQFRRKNK